MKQLKYEGALNNITTHKIYLNINYLHKGEYRLIIIYKNKVIKTTHFTKK